MAPTGDFTLPPGPEHLASTLEVQFAPSIVALAQELGSDPIIIRNWAYDHIGAHPQPRGR